MRDLIAMSALCSEIRALQYGAHRRPIKNNFQQELFQKKKKKEVTELMKFFFVTIEVPWDVIWGAHSNRINGPLLEDFQID